MSERIGTYEIVSELGRGATGAVYLAHDASGADVAIKVLDPALAADAAFRARFAREADAMARLHDPHCVAIYDHHDAPDRAWLAMEYVDGASLRSVLQSAGTLTPAQACGVMLGSLSGLDHAHGIGVVHRDFKPDNVLVDREGESKLGDFGLTLDHTDTETWRAIEGTPAYMSPEQVRGGQLDARSDVYAAGCVLYELLTGHPPYELATPLAVMHAQVDGEPPDVSMLPAGIGSVVSTAVAKDPSARHQSAREFASALQGAADRDLGAGWLASAGIAGLVAGVVATRAASPSRSKRRSRKPLYAGAAAVVVAGLVVGGVALASGSGSKNKPVAAPVNAVATTIAPTTSTTVRNVAVPLVDPCIVGTWHTVSDVSFYQDDDNGVTYHLAGGAGIVRVVAADGTDRDDYAHAAPYTGTGPNGKEIVSTFTGSSSSHVTARGGVETGNDQDFSNLHFTTVIGGSLVPGTHFIPGPTTSRYKCTAGGFTETNSTGDTVWAKGR